MTTPPEEASLRPAWLRPVLRLAVLALGALHALVAVRELSMNEDGISYLDMGDACARGDWDMAVNAVWSPLYACLLGVAAGIVDPPMEWEFALAHAVNLLVFTFALLCFEWFWFRSLHPLRRAGSGESMADFPEWAWTLMGYALFAWVALQLIQVWAVTPDMLMAAFLFLAAGLFVRAVREPTSGWPPLALGATLGLAYLAKAVMFPVSLVFIALLALAGPLRRNLGRAALALVAFLVVAGPWVAAISLDKGRFTFGEAGHITYVRYVNGVPYPHWRPEEAPRAEQPHHPTRRIFSEPEIWEFGYPVGGTYPPGYDPSHWYEGVSARVAPGELAAALARNLMAYFDLFFRDLGGPLAVLSLLLVLGHIGGTSRDPPGSRRELGTAVEELAGGRSGIVGARGGLALSAFAALAAYALVHIETRYVGAFLVLLAAAALSSVRLPGTPWGRRALAAGALLVVLFLGLQLAVFHLEKGAPALGITLQPPPVAEGEPTGPRDDPAPPTAIGRAALEAGLDSGDRIAYVGYAFGAYFARLARLRIVAEVPWEEMETFWSVEPARREAALRALEETGATGVVAGWVPGDTVPAGWERLGETHHLLLRLPLAGHTEAEGSLSRER